MVEGEALEQSVVCLRNLPLMRELEWHVQGPKLLLLLFLLSAGVINSAARYRNHKQLESSTTVGLCITRSMVDSSASQIREHAGRSSIRDVVSYLSYNFIV